MEQQLDLDNLTKEDFMQMAEYVAHVEAVNKKLLEDLREAKSYLSATIQQRNSAEAKLRNVLDMRMNTVPLTTEVIKTEIVSAIDLMNPEQYREKKNQR
jgi:hypothetical protein